tara:strand:- start:1312 stop:2727 length:1416 start_codon:yes stop_codon:yes gene_type:complete
MNKSHILKEKLRKNFEFNPTPQQDDLINDISDFVCTLGNKSIFLLKGYAGTGKTSLISSLVKSLSSVYKRSSLLAPTGRAAKVLSGYSNKTAHTIHKKIYWIKTNSKGNTYVTLQENLNSNCIFIVDEASMIPSHTDKNFGNRNLLSDLVEYIYSGSDCKLILIGDTAQLPPVHLDVSPALDEYILEKEFNKQVIVKELTHVFRQDSDSLILKNATNVRETISKGINKYPQIKCNEEVIRLNGGDELQEKIESSYNNFGIESTIVICKSNKRAYLYNQQIRHKILWKEERISIADFLMVVRNNYSWLEDESKAGFIANGDIIKIKHIKKYEELYGFNFAHVSIELVDYPEELEIDVIVMLDTLESEQAALDYERYKELYNKVSQDYNYIKNTYKRNKAIKEDKYLNALQIKYAYAITCHKSQGGQWKSVFVDQSYFTDDMLNKEYLRWFYTSITRSSDKLYLINFSDKFFD